MVDNQSPTAEIRRGKKKEEEEEKNRLKIYMVSLFHRATINNDNVIIPVPSFVMLYSQLSHCKRLFGSSDECRR